MAYEPLHHKYRPQTFGALVGQDAIATTLANALRQRRIAPAYLFCGPRGTGKTSSARILAKSLNCIAQDHPTPEPCGLCETCRSITNGSALDFIEIDAASNTGVDNIRELIERAQFAPVQCRYKVYVIDECHMLSTAAFNALLKTLEEPPSSVVFILATTDPQRVLPTIISRCQRFDYRRIPLEPMIGHLRKIADLEDIAIDDEALRLVGQVSQGGLRDAQSLLDQLSLLEPPIGADAVWDLVGAVPERDLLALVQAILSDDGSAVLDGARKLMDRGREPLIVLQNLAGFYRDLLIAKTAGDRHDLVAITPPTWADMQGLVETLDPALFLLGQQHLRTAEVQVKNTTQPRLWLEVTLLGLLPSAVESQLLTTTTKNTTKKNFGEDQKNNKPSLLIPTRVNAQNSNSPQELSTEIEKQGNETNSQKIQSKNDSKHLQASKEGIKDLSKNNILWDPNDLDLQNLWAKVLDAIEFYGAKTLFSQYGCLLGFDGETARVGILSQWYPTTKEQRLKFIEEAFKKVNEKSIRISLEAISEQQRQLSSHQNQLNNDLEKPSNSQTGQISALREQALDSLNNTADTPRTLGSLRKEDIASSEAVKKGLEDVIELNPQGQPESSIGSRPPYSNSLPEIDGEIDRVVKNFAQFFNGQVVNLGDDLSADPNKSTIQLSDAAAKQPSHPDDDVPF
ncbi:DNA polymerase III subunit gamma/tau [Nodosilinea nodulosa]|uniref:DNA polymerase III subunit gamma/tau n=1 Tax=Nodosilinea nodulosa TaxID=416001 RepID=UPI0002DB20FC|nr:DNA polymerase III subunit gamma/tau [Nodosilinea nodulosa]